MKGETKAGGAILKLCAVVIRGAAGLDDAELPVLDLRAETARVLALEAVKELDELRRLARENQI